MIEERDVEFSIYEVPATCCAMPDWTRSDPEAAGLAIGGEDRPLATGRPCSRTCAPPNARDEIAVVGKYIELHDAYKSIYEALAHAGIANHANVKIRKMRRRGAVLADGTVSALEGVRRVCSCRAASVSAAWRARSPPRAGRARTTCPSSASAWGCRRAVIEFARHVAESGGRPHDRALGATRRTR